MLIVATSVVNSQEIPKGQTQRSLPSTRVTIEVTGGFHHRRPAMELVRQIIEERTAGRRYHHRLMDYNNDPSTSLADVHAIFAEALARIDRSPQ